MKKEYLPQVTAERIKSLASANGISISKLNEICELSKNTIAQTGKGTEGMKARNLFLIAETLDCSIDYLLGRTEQPSMKSETNVSVAGDINAPVVNNSGKMVDSANTPEPNLDEMQQELLNQFGKLDIKDKVAFLHQIIQKAEEIKNG